MLSTPVSDIRLAIKKCLAPRRMGWACAVVLFPAMTHGVFAAAAAESGSAASGGALEEVVISARFRSENLQEAPISVVSVSADALEKQNVSSTVDLGRVVPNLQVFEGGVIGHFAAAYMRGLGQSDGSFALEPGVGVYLDDIYIGSLYGSLMTLGDIDRVEVLRGPQGTLFGKNTEGGAMRLSSAEAKGDNTGYVVLGRGDYNHTRVQGMIDIPLGSDRLALRLSGGSEQMDGYVDRIDFACAHPELAGNIKPTTSDPACKVGTQGGGSSVALRANLRWQPTDNLTVKLNADMHDDKSEPAPFVIAAMNSNYPGAYVGLINPGVFVPTFGIPYDERFLTGSPYKTYITYNDPTSGFSPNLENTYNGWGLANSTQWRTPWGFDVTNIVGYRTEDSHYIIQSSAATIPTLPEEFFSEHQQTSEELRLSGELGKFEWTVGGYYYLAIDRLYGEYHIPGFGVHTRIDDPARNHSYAGFVHGIYHATDKLSLEVGARYSAQDKYYGYNRVLLPPSSPTPILVPGFDPPPNYKIKSSQTDPKVAIQYQWTPDLMTYVSYTTGFKAGGINPRPVTIEDVISFNPEKVQSYELGAKTQWFDNRLRLNADVFYQKVKDLQQLVVLPGHIGGTIINTGSMHMIGVEADLLAEPIHGLLLNASVGTLHTTIDSLGLAAGQFEGPTLDSKPQYVPELKYNVGVQYDWDMGNFGTFTPRVDYSYQSTVYFDNQNNAPGEPERAYQPGYGLWGLHFGWVSPNKKTELSVSIDNVTNKSYFSNEFNLLSVWGVVDGVPGKPRNLLVTLKQNFAL